MAKQSEALSGNLQDNVLTALIFGETAPGVIRAAVDVSLFTNRAYRDIVSRAYDYVDKYKRGPGEHIADELDDLLKQEGEHSKQIAEALRNAMAQVQSPAFNERYILDDLHRFIRQQSLKVGIVQAHEAVQRGDLDGAEKALKEAARVRTEAFSPGISLKGAIKLLANPDTQRDVLHLGIKELDRLHLGPARQELHLMIAPPKKGKSWWLVHCAARAIIQRWRGVYVTLELADKFVARRMLQNLFSARTREDAEVRVPHFVQDEEGTLTAIEMRDHKSISIATPEQVLKLSKRVDDLRLEPRLLMKSFPTGSLTVAALEAYLDQLEAFNGFVPDFIILDYADLMRVDSKNYRIDLGNLYKDLRGLAVERNLAMITASQANRGGADARLIRDSDVAEDFSKIATSDCVMTYNQTALERMRGLARIYVSNGRVEADRFSVCVAQSYTIGQFALTSYPMLDNYWQFIDPNEGDERMRDPV